MVRTRWLIAGLMAIPLADALLLVVVAAWIGWVEMVALVVLTALVGLALVRAEGRHTIRKLQRDALDGTPPTDHLLDGALLLVAGAFLLTPGLVTDAIGFVLAVPPTRYPVKAALKRWVIVPYVDDKTGGLGTGAVYTFGFPDDDRDGGDTIDVDADAYDVSFDDDADSSDPNSGP